jgi:hypothetical protein
MLEIFWGMDKELLKGPVPQRQSHAVATITILRLKFQEKYCVRNTVLQKALIPRPEFLNTD